MVSEESGCSGEDLEVVRVVELVLANFTKISEAIIGERISGNDQVVL